VGIAREDIPIRRRRAADGVALRAAGDLDPTLGVGLADHAARIGADIVSCHQVPGCSAPRKIDPEGEMINDQTADDAGRCSDRKTVVRSLPRPGSAQDDDGTAGVTRL
jgi:hypothetical protein